MLPVDLVSLAVAEGRDAVLGMHVFKGRVSLNDENRVVRVWYRGDAAEEDPAMSAAFRSIRELSAADNPDVSNAGIASIARLTTLEILDLTDDRRVIDAHVSALRPLASLKRLGLAGTAVTDRGREQFRGRCRTVKS